MVNLSGDISNSIYKRSIANLHGNVLMSGKMLELLVLLDGRTNLRAVSQKMHLGISDVRPLLSKLLKYGIIEEVQHNIEVLDPQFLGYMAEQLSRIAGPIAQVMVEDAVLKISDGSSEVAQHQAAELIEMLGRQIPDETRRVEFIQNMLRKLRDM